MFSQSPVSMKRVSLLKPKVFVAGAGHALEVSEETNLLGLASGYRIAHGQLGRMSRLFVILSFDTPHENGV
jgi:hypothetical protein